MLIKPIAKGLSVNANNLHGATGNSFRENSVKLVLVCVLVLYHGFRKAFNTRLYIGWFGEEVVAFVFGDQNGYLVFVLPYAVIVDFGVESPVGDVPNLMTL